MGTRRVWAEINIHNLQHNIQAIQRSIPAGTDIMAVVKADAYGHGYEIISQALEETGIRYFGVATEREALSLRKKGIQGEILVFGKMDRQQVPECIDSQITQTVFSVDHGKMISEEAKLQKRPVRVHVKLDTGMSRAGIPVYTDASLEELEKVYQLPYLDMRGIYSHFSCADEPEASSVAFTEQQIALFQRAIAYLEEKGYAVGKKHIQNSAGIINYDLDYDLVRPGISMYGYLPGREARKDLQLRPVMELKTQVVLVKTIPAGTPVSYGRTYIADSEKKVATLSIGYGDGYPRALSNRGQVLINGQRAPILGRVCMDQMVVDVTHIAQVKEGDEATLFGGGSPNSISADDIAGTVGTISYEILCALGKRVERLPIR